MKNPLDFVKFLGPPYKDADLNIFLEIMEISAEPILAKNDVTTHIGNPKLGIELTFRDERYLDVKLRTYMAEALVLSSFEFSGLNTKNSNLTLEYFHMVYGSV